MAQVYFYGSHYVHLCGGVKTYTLMYALLQTLLQRSKKLSLQPKIQEKNPREELSQQKKLLAGQRKYPICVYSP